MLFCNIAAETRFCPTWKQCHRGIEVMSRATPVLLVPVITRTGDICNDYAPDGYAHAVGQSRLTGENTHRKYSYFTGWLQA